MSSKKDILKRVLAEASEPTVALNPLTGFQFDDIRKIARKTALQGARQPLVMAKHLAGHGQKLVDIVAGSSSYGPDSGDHRFHDVAWQDSGVFHRLMQSYFAFNESLEDWVDDLDLDEVDRLRAAFLMRVIGDSVAPTNNLLSNPAALRKAKDTKGKSVWRGLSNFIRDARENHGMPSQVKGDRFELGKNIAVSPGAVVYSNELLELIQYSPSTSKVYRRPVLLVPAMINKFYAMDLTPERSLIKFCVDSGLQVFVASWANPGMEHADWGIEKYAMALLDAMAAIQSITRSKSLNLFALCSGAMMASAMAAYLDAKGSDLIHSMTIGVCMLEMQQRDMEMSAFSTPEIFEKVKERSRKAGILRGHELALSMLWLRPQDLIWSNVVNNYLLGNEPPEFDLLYWNNDWTNLPAKLHGDVIDMFSTGCITRRGDMEIDGVGLDLEALDCDKFFVGGLSDHITPWKACYRTVHAFGGNKEFVLSNSGHMQTMLNSPTKKRASYFLNEKLPDSAEDWLEGAELQQGSWWSHWQQWVQPRSGTKKAAPKKLGNKQFPSGAAAPGTYVHQQSE